MPVLTCTKTFGCDSLRRKSGFLEYCNFYMDKQNQNPTRLNMLLPKSISQNNESGLGKHEIKKKIRRQKVEELYRHHT